MDRLYRWCRVREAGEQVEEKSFWVTKSVAETGRGVGGGKLGMIFESVCLILPARLPVSRSVLDSYAC